MRRRAALAGMAAPILLASAGCHTLPPPTPLDKLGPEQAAGYTVFQSRCAVCHMERQDRDSKGPSLAGIFKKPYLHSGAPANDDRVSATVLHGRGMMPAQPNLDAQEIAALLAYLHTV